MNPPTAPSSRFRYLSFAPVTAALVAANVAVFLWMVVRGVPLTSPSSLALLAWGGNMPVFTLTGDGWRLFTSLFLHAGLVHVGLNMYVLAFTGPRVEWEFGKARMLAIYLAGGLLASCASTFWSDFHATRTGLLGGPSVGASGAIMALFGALLAGMLLPPPGVSEAVARRGVDKALIKVIAINLGAGFLIQGVDQAAHVGGLIGGFLVGAFMAVAPGATRPLATAARYVAALALVSACVFALLHRHRDDLRELRTRITIEMQLDVHAHRARARATSGPDTGSSGR